MKIKTNWEVSKGSGDEREILRSFESVDVNLFNTLKENLDFYGEQFVVDCLLGSSINVKIQNHIRARSALRNEAGDDWKFTEKEIREYVAGYVPSMSASTVAAQEEYKAASPELRAELDNKKEQKRIGKDIDRKIAELKAGQKPQGSTGTVVKDRKQGQ